MTILFYSGWALLGLIDYVFYLTIKRTKFIFFMVNIDWE